MSNYANNIYHQFIVKTNQISRRKEVKDIQNKVFCITKPCTINIATLYIMYKGEENEDDMC